MGAGLIEVTEAAPDFDLTTLVRVKQELDLTDVDATRDAFLEVLITEASAAAASFTQRIFAKQQYQESIGGEGDEWMLVRVRPIVTLDEALFENDPLTDVVVSDADAGMLYRRYGFRWTAPIGAGISRQPRVGHELPLYVMTYTAGYVLPGSAWSGEGDRTLPYDVENAAVISVCEWYANRGKGSTVKAKKVGDYSITYNAAGKVEGGDPSGMPLRATALLMPWKNYG